MSTLNTSKKLPRPIPADAPYADEISAFGFATMLLRNQSRIARWALIGAAITAVWLFTRPALYVASASFVPQGNDPARSGLASLAGQFGVAITSGNQAESPDFYANLLKSRVLLQNIVNDTLVVPELGGRRIIFLDLFDINPAEEKRRDEEAIRKLKRVVTTSVVKTTGTVQLAVATKWPSVSLAIATQLIQGVDDYNQRTRKGQAAAERKFVEERLGVAGAELRNAEDQLEAFSRVNRQFSSSPELTFQRERLQRAVSLRQQVFTSLSQSYEEVRMREVRDTPVITVVEPPSVASLPEPRGRVLGILFGLFLGGLFGTVLSFISTTTARRQEAGDPEVEEFVISLHQARSGMLGVVRALIKRISRQP